MTTDQSPVVPSACIESGAGAESEGDAEALTDMDERRRSYWNLFDFAAEGRGLEIGPLHRPMVKRGEAEVSYLDVMDRAALLEHYAADAIVMAGGIPEIDYHLIQSDGRTLSLVEAAGPGAPFDWVMASHVIEHVPDVIGWLAEVAEIVRDGGSLVLAVPDRRYCFDVHRPPTTMGQMVAAHEAGDRRPSVGAVYDYFASSVSYDLAGLWAGEYPTLDSRIHTLAEARTHVERTVAGEYVDCHVWLFTPDSLVRQLHELRVSGLSPWTIETITQTPAGDLEFQVVLRRLARGSDHTAPQEGEVLPVGDLPDWLRESAGVARTAELQRQLTRLTERFARRGRRLDNLRTELDRRERRIKRLRRQLRAAQRELNARPTYVGPAAKVSSGVGRLASLGRRAASRLSGIGRG